MAKQVEFELNLALQKYTRSMSAAIKTGARFDAQMKELQKTARAVSKELDKLGGKITMSIEADVNTGGIKSDIEAITPTVDVKADVNEGAIRGDIEAISPEVQVKGDVNEASIKGDIEGISAEAEVRGDVNQSQIRGDIESVRGEAKVKGDVDLADIQKQIEGLNARATISIVLQGAAMGREAFNQTPVLGDLNDRQTAENTLQASRTGLDVAEGMAAVGAVWAQNWGSSRTEIAGVVRQVDLLSGADEDLTDATTAIYELTAGGRELEEVFRAASVLVTTGVAGSFREAADLIATGFMTAAGTSEDFLDTLSEYAPQLTELGITGEQFISFLNEGVTEGAWNTDTLANSLKEANLRLEEAVGMSEGPAFDALTRLGQVDEAEAYIAGETTGTEFVAGLVAAAEAEGTNFDLFEIFGSGVEDLGSTVFTNIDWEAIDAAPAVEGAAAEYGAILTDSIGADWSALMRTFNEEFIGVVDNMTGGIDGWVADVRTKIQTLGAELRSGTGLPEALEIALQAPGLADKIHDLEVGIGHFIIEFVNAIGQMVNIFDQTAGASILDEVARLASGQLSFDLINADSQAEIEAAITYAMSRGVEAAGIETAVTTAVTDLAAEDNLARAEALMTMIQEMPPIPLAGSDAPVNNITDVSMFPEDLWDKMIEGGPVVEMNFDAAADALDAAELAAIDASFELDEATLSLANWASGADEMGTAAGEMATAADRSVEQVNAAADALLLDLQTTAPEIIAELEAIETAYEGIGQAAYDAWVATGGSEGTYPTGVPGRAAGGPVSGGQTYMVGERGPELFVPGMDGAIIPHQLTTLLMGLPGFSGGNSSIVNNTSIVVNTNINSSGAAQLMGNAGRVAKAIRGF